MGVGPVVDLPTVRRLVGLRIVENESLSYGTAPSVASCGPIKVGNLDFRAPSNLSMFGRDGICAGVSHTHEADGYLQREGN